MCHPAAYVGIGALSAYSSYSQEVASVKAQSKAYSQNVQNTLQAYADETRQLNLRERQEKDAAATKKIQNDLQAMQLQSRARVASANSGVYLNNAAVMQNLTRQGLVANEMIQTNLDQAEAQLQEARTGAATTAQSRINAVARPTFNRGQALLRAGIQGASTAAMAYGAFGMAAPASAGVTAGTTAGSASATTNVFTGATPQMSVAPKFVF